MRLLLFQLGIVGVLFEDSFKIVEKLWYPGRGEMRGALFGLVRLLLIVQDVRDRMVRLARASYSH